MDEYSATDHSVILTQQGEEGKNAKTNSAAAAHKKKSKSFHENISGACVFMWNDSKPLLLSARDTKGSKTPKTTFLKSSRTDTVLKGVIRRGLATLFAVSLNVQTGASNINVFTVQACVCCNRGRTSPIYLHVVMFSSLLFVPALFNVALVPPPVLADPTGSQVCRRAMLAAPSLRGWIRCVCHGERWFGVGSTEARWVLEQAASCHSRSLTLLCSQGLLLHV